MIATVCCVGDVVADTAPFRTILSLATLEDPRAAECVVHPIRAQSGTLGVAAVLHSRAVSSVDTDENTVRLTSSNASECVRKVDKLTRLVIARMDIMVSVTLS